MEQKDCKMTEFIEPSFYVDGCKVTVRYNRENNPEAIRIIQKILLSCAKFRTD